MSDGFEKLDSGLPADPLDGVLVSALRGRREPAAGIDLAAAALERVRGWELQERSLARLAALNRWMRVATFGAAALIALVVGLGYRYWPAAVEATDSATDTASTATYTVDWSMVGLGVLGVTVVVVMMAMLFGGDRPQMRVAAG
jgi:hypothetical protein